MSKVETIPHSNETRWTSVQAYVLAAFCLVLGVTLGYLFRGSASPAASAATPAPASSPAATEAEAQPTPEQLKEMFDKSAGPLLAAVQANPSDFDSIVKLANLYYDTKQYPQAIDYYNRALKIQPNNADVTTDLGTAYWYTGDADKAIAQFKKSLQIRPGHAGTLFNMGLVEWQGKANPAGAVTAWEELLKKNPDYPQKQQVENYIAQAKEHSKG
jgi:cytochrome c-type biogenesis protein CcmH/NrfG